VRRDGAAVLSPLTARHPPQRLGAVLPEVADFCRLVLLRHPELATSHREVAVGAGAAPLSRRGRARALEWGEVLRDVPIDRIVCCDQPQCADPAAVLGQARELAVEPEPRLRDQQMGNWQGQRWDELLRSDGERVRAFFASFAEIATPQGESLGQAVERALAWWTELAPSVAGKTLAVVAAGSILSGFTAAMLGMRLSRCISLHLPHGGVGVLDVFANGVRVSAWNVDALVR
jgi:broad specificity phosphatase PhoE